LDQLDKDSGTVLGQAADVEPAQAAGL
jgi:hypothetical protein